jgi:Ca-activated chloride channel homolog
MKLANPQLLTLLWIIPLLISVTLWAAYRRRSASNLFAEKALQASLRTGKGDKYFTRSILSILAILLIIIASAQPQWGFYWKENKSRGIEILIAIDTSKSMLAGDIAPDRLTYVKNGIRDFILNLENDRIGLLAFSGKAFLQCPLTADYNGCLLLLNGIDTDSIPRGGTSISGAIDETIHSMQGSTGTEKILILITDGENTEGDLDRSIQKAIDEEITIYSIGIGTENGSRIPITDKDGKITYQEDADGNIIRSSLDENILKRIADKTGGKYLLADMNNFGLEEIYDIYLSKIERKENKEDMIKVPKQRYQPFILAAVFLLMLELSLRLRT